MAIRVTKELRPGDLFTKDGRGTADMVRRAHHKGIPVHRIGW